MPVNLALLILLQGSLYLAANAQSPAGGPYSIERVRHIILHSRTLGAHGMGYSSQPLNTLSRKLTPTDIPTLIGLAADQDLHVGVNFALASQCEAALIPVREAVMQHRVPFLEAEDVMGLIEDFGLCTQEAQQGRLRCAPKFIRWVRQSRGGRRRKQRRRGRRCPHPAKRSQDAGLGAG